MELCFLHDSWAGLEQIGFQAQQCKYPDNGKGWEHDRLISNLRPIFRFAQKLRAAETDTT